MAPLRLATALDKRIISITPDTKVPKKQGTGGEQLSKAMKDRKIVEVSEDGML